MIEKNIPNFEGYTVTNEGKVYSTKRENRKKELKLERTRNGYNRVTFCKDGKTTRFLVHRLVAAVFLGERDRPMMVNHKDGNKTNNHVDNLEWVTCSENTIHAFENGLRRTERTVLTDEVLGVISIMLDKGYSQRKIARELGINRNASYRASRIIKGERYY
ncbi:HNH endonuclease [Bacillus phage 1_ICo-2020]|uniref:HNH endonuclease n=1 Tax=Bacillus phage 1_ICo-2020 TaxID=2759272 RepID=A0A7G8AKE1_9CAUD|nr:HNH endonuclease [Bacillus phage 1_ICo-2020]